MLRPMILIVAVGVGALTAACSVRHERVVEPPVTTQRTTTVTNDPMVPPTTTTTVTRYR